MTIIEADVYRDGGTVYAVIENNGAVTRFEFDYSLPWDGRKRTISRSADRETRVLEIGSKEEKEVCYRIKGLLEDKYGEELVRDALNNSHAREVAWNEHCARQEGLFVSAADFNDPYPLPFEGLWLAVFSFVENACREGKL